MSLQFYEVQHIYVSFCLGLLMSNNPLSIWCHEDLPIYFLLNYFIVLALILNILVYFGWIIIYGVRQGVQHDFLSISLSYCPSTVCAERIILPHWIKKKNQLAKDPWIYSKFLILFCCSICLLLHHYHTFLMIVALW